MYAVPQRFDHHAIAPARFPGGAPDGFRAAGLDEMVRAERAKEHEGNAAHRKEECTGS
ncbi:hypothetical protein GCM10011578_033290 [Streptomyces fuscichromogenes]|uniref:Uncharacterized protein n=1 Tax=Streptomyces fuscichromogenes TaxID=1324013 RepID=A0A918CRP1_9ACTN|nr:hypothetical protein GCM10011578_033290 [Streptomyces fuscichromogenes]